MERWEKIMNHAISIRIVEKLTSKKYDEEDIQCLKCVYALECILAEGEKTIVIFLFFALFHQAMQFFACFITTVLIRTFLGGIHQKTMFRCVMFSILIYTAAILCGHYIEIPTLIMVVIVLGEMVIVYLFAPIPSKERPIYTQSQRKKLKFNALAGVAICSVILIGFSEVRNTMVWMMLLQQIECYLAQKNMMERRKAEWENIGKK